MPNVLLYTQNLPNAKNEIEAAGGRITQMFTANLFVAELPLVLLPEQLAESTPSIPESVDATSRIAADAWVMQLEKSAVKGLSPNFTDGLPWDTEGFEAPREMTRHAFHDKDAAIDLSTGTPTSLYMTGHIAVGLVIVSGTGDLSISREEAQVIISEVQEGLDFLTAAEPRAKIVFDYDIRIVDVTARPGSQLTFESAESPWRNEALGKMGFTPGLDGSIDFVNHIKSEKGSQWGYVAYFTKYPLHHFAYAVNERLVMSYFNDGWGTKSINAVFAHETCHIFGAADEYGNCSCDTVHGYLSVPNRNCRACTPNSAQCLMKENTLVICEWTRQQIGWDNSLYPAS